MVYAQVVPLAAAHARIGEDLPGRVKAALRARTLRIARFLDLRMDGLIAVWIATILLAAWLKLDAVPLTAGGVAAPAALARLLLPYLAIAVAPVAGYRLAAGSFPRGLLSAQPSFRLARYGRWNQLDVVAARRNPAFGPAGFMASLTVGILLNVPVRTVEFLVAMPPIPDGAPGWAHNLQFGLVADLVVMNFFYMVCFVMALRAVPLFPRMLLFAWALDIGMQFRIAELVAGSPGLPAAVATALNTMLHGNLDKVCISAGVWLPYLLLSDRANVTFRHRVRAGGRAAMNTAQSLA